MLNILVLAVLFTLEHCQGVASLRLGRYTSSMGGSTERTWTEGQYRRGTRQRQGIGELTSPSEPRRETRSKPEYISVVPASEYLKSVGGRTGAGHGLAVFDHHKPDHSKLHYVPRNYHSNGYPPRLAKKVVPRPVYYLIGDEHPIVSSSGKAEFRRPAENVLLHSSKKTVKLSRGNHPKKLAPSGYKAVKGIPVVEADAADNEETRASGDMDAGQSGSLDSASMEQRGMLGSVKQGGDRVEFQMYGVNGPNSYKFGYDTGSGENRHFRFEERDSSGRVRGHYGYLDNDGKMRIMKYEADPETGFRAGPVEQSKEDDSE